jgi:phosphopantothenoylcysteine decarboxylase/phosphopantothenate--cysteine ligase
MNVEMWNNPANQENYQKLLQFKYKFIGPVIGEMACGEVGVGKMSSPEEIILTIKNHFLSKNLFNSKNLKALVTAGGTREYIDPVRFLSNESSGKQGLEIAMSLNELGFKTKLVIGPNSLNIKNQNNLEVINVTTSKQMFEACKDNLPVDVAVCAAAVADFKVKNYSEEKIKKEGIEYFNLELEKNIDILSFISSQNINRPRLVVGFAAETQNIIENAQKKIQNKRCDWIVANNVADKSIGFNSDYNEVFLISKNKEVEKFNKSTKSEIAKKLSNKILHALIQ